MVLYNLSISINLAKVNYFIHVKNVEDKSDLWPNVSIHCRCDFE